MWNRHDASAAIRCGRNTRVCGGLRIHRGLCQGPLVQSSQDRIETAAPALPESRAKFDGLREHPAAGEAKPALAPPAGPLRSAKLRVFDCLPHPTNVADCQSIDIPPV